MRGIDRPNTRRSQPPAAAGPAPSRPAPLDSPSLPGGDADRPGAFPATDGPQPSVRPGRGGRRAGRSASAPSVWHLLKSAFVAGLLATAGLQGPAAAACTGSSYGARRRTPGALDRDDRRVLGDGPPPRPHPRAEALAGARSLASVPPGGRRTRADEAAELQAALMDLFEARPGRWRGAEWWQLPNILETMLDYADAVEAGGWEGAMAQQAALTRVLKKNGCFDFINPAFDDTGWWGLALARAYTRTGEPSQLRGAEKIFEHLVKRGWDESTCGGGMKWQVTVPYKNAVTTEILILLAARLERIHQDRPGYDGRYVAWAKKALDWLENSGMIQPSGEINDGLDAECKNNGGPAWTYNQGIILGALAELYSKTGNATYLDRAFRIAGENFRLNSEGGVLSERACGVYTCAENGPAFKGIFVRGLADLLAVAPADDPRRASLEEHVAVSADAAYAHRGDDGLVGDFWDRASTSERPAAAQASALDVVLAALRLGR